MYVPRCRAFVCQVALFKCPSHPSHNNTANVNGPSSQQLSLVQVPRAKPWHSMDVEVVQQRAGSTHSPTTQAAGPWVESSRHGDPSSFSQPSLQPSLTTQTALTRPDDLALSTRMRATSSTSVVRRRGCRQQQDSRGVRWKTMEIKNRDSRIENSKSTEVAPLFPVPFCANKAAPAAACPRRQPMRRRALCGVACATKGSRTVEVRSSPQGNQCFGSKMDAVEAQMAKER
jgi:hypothetical protein